ncbi:hypothetical protein HDU76_003003 [Blyttiomyces sp. JEL0837]|nr:hypothetical protein HDU76_003003 [Blyttiomyces sp. JEL0837]
MSMGLQWRTKKFISSVSDAETLNAIKQNWKTSHHLGPKFFNGSLSSPFSEDCFQITSTVSMPVSSKLQLQQQQQESFDFEVSAMITPPLTPVPGVSVLLGKRQYDDEVEETSSSGSSGNITFDESSGSISRENINDDNKDNNMNNTIHPPRRKNPRLEKLKTEKQANVDAVIIKSEKEQIKLTSPPPRNTFPSNYTPNPTLHTQKNLFLLYIHTFIQVGLFHANQCSNDCLMFGSCLESEDWTVLGTGAKKGIAMMRVDADKWFCDAVGSPKWVGRVGMGEGVGKEGEGEDGEGDDVVGFIKRYQKFVQERDAKKEEDEKKEKEKAKEKKKGKGKTKGEKKEGKKNSNKTKQVSMSELVGYCDETIALRKLLNYLLKKRWDVRERVRRVSSSNMECEARVNEDPLIQLRLLDVEDVLCGIQKYREVMLGMEDAESENQSEDCGVEVESWADGEEYLDEEELPYEIVIVEV